MTREEAIEVYNGLINTKIKEAFEFFAPELRESEDERIRKELANFLRSPFIKENLTDEKVAPWIAYLERQKEPIDPFDTKLFQDGVKEGRRLEREDIEKEPIPIPDKFSGLKSLMLQYLQSAANRKDDTEIESDTDLWGRKILDYVWRYSEKQKEQKPAEWSEDKFPKDIEKDATQFCFDKGFNITPYQAKEIATHYLMIGHNFGYVEGRKNAHIPAKELGLPSSMDFKQEWSEEDEKIRRNLMSLLVNMRGDRITEETYQKYYPWLKDLRSRPKPSDNWKPSDEQMGALNYAYCELFKREDVEHNILGPLQNLIDTLRKL